ncbi:hypothetical protein MMC09_005842 [Bachmanniomyces sp. S44760]|nr:hypothetical protein [Bachmanniomyces sp. S44760]
MPSRYSHAFVTAHLSPQDQIYSNPDSRPESPETLIRTWSPKRPASQNHHGRRHPIPVIILEDDEEPDFPDLPTSTTPSLHSHKISNTESIASSSSISSDPAPSIATRIYAPLQRETPPPRESHQTPFNSAPTPLPHQSPRLGSPPIARSSSFSFPLHNTSDQDLIRPSSDKSVSTSASSPDGLSTAKTSLDIGRSSHRIHTIPEKTVEEDEDERPQEQIDDEEPYFGSDEDDLEDDVSEHGEFTSDLETLPSLSPLSSIFPTRYVEEKITPWEHRHISPAIFRYNLPVSSVLDTPSKPLPPISPKQIVGKGRAPKSHDASADETEYTYRGDSSDDAAPPPIAMSRQSIDYFTPPPSSKIRNHARTLSTPSAAVISAFANSSAKMTNTRDFRARFPATHRRSRSNDCYSMPQSQPVATVQATSRSQDRPVEPFVDLTVPLPKNYVHPNAKKLMPPPPSISGTESDTSMQATTRLSTPVSNIAPTSRIGHAAVSATRPHSQPTPHSQAQHDEYRPTHSNPSAVTKHHTPLHQCSLPTTRPSFSQRLSSESKISKSNSNSNLKSNSNPSLDLTTLSFTNQIETRDQIQPQPNPSSSSHDSDHTKHEPNAHNIQPPMPTHYTPGKTSARDSRDVTVDNRGHLNRDEVNKLRKGRKEGPNMEYAGKAQVGSRGRFGLGWV